MSCTSKSVAAYPLGSALPGAGAVLDWNDVTKQGREDFYDWHVGSQSAVMCRYLSTDAFPSALALTGVVACHLYAADQDDSHLRTTESNTREFDVPSWVLLPEATILRAAEQARALIDGPELRRLGVIVRSDTAIYSLEICRPASPATAS